MDARTLRDTPKRAGASISTTKAGRLALIAAAAGTLHAAFSLYWAIGGTFLLDTVGDWAVDLTADEPLWAGLGLGALGAAKLAAAWVPLLVVSGHARWAGRIWRRLAWVGGGALTLYGALNTVVALAVVSGIVQPDGGYDEAAMWGHAALWDPLFLVWGLATLGALWAPETPRRQPSRRMPARTTSTSR